MQKELISRQEILAKLQQDSDKQNKECDALDEIEHQREIAIKVVMHNMIQSLNVPLYALINDIKSQQTQCVSIKE